MIIPLMGYVGKLKYLAIGLTMGNGFLLEIIERNKTDPRTLFFKTKNFNNGIAPYKPSVRSSIFLIIISFLITITLSLINFSAHFDPHGHLVSVIILSIFNGFIVPIFSFLYFFYITSWICGLVAMFSDKDSNEWHACEHKSIVLIESGLKPTVKNLKKMPTVLLGCSISVYGTEIETHASLLIMALSYRLIPPDIMTIIIALLPALLISYFCLELNLGLKFETFGNCLLAVIAFPIMIIPLMAEKIFTLREPSEEKYRETARELKRFIKINQIYPLA